MGFALRRGVFSPWTQNEPRLARHYTAGPDGKVGNTGRTVLFPEPVRVRPPTPYTRSVTGGALPPGLRVIRASNGNRIEGTPTILSEEVTDEQVCVLCGVAGCASPRG